MFQHLVSDRYLYNYIFHFLGLRELVNVSQLCRNFKNIINENNSFAMIQKRKNKGYCINDIFNYGSHHDIYVCKLLYYYFCDQINNNNILSSCPTSIDSQCVHIDMTNAFITACNLNKNIYLNWFNKNYSIIKYQSMDLNYCYFISDYEHKCILVNKIFLHLCEMGYSEVILYLIQNFNIDNTIIISAFTESLYNNHFKICEYLLIHYDFIDTLLNFDLPNLINTYKLQDKHESVIWLNNYHKKLN